MQWNWCGLAMIKVGPRYNRRELSDDEICEYHRKMCDLVKDYGLSTAQLCERFHITEHAFHAIIRRGNELRGIKYEPAYKGSLWAQGSSHGRRITKKST